MKQDFGLIDVFFIDDDIDDQEILSFIMKESFDHVRCTFANDGKEALNKLQERSFSPDVIFLDINMPRMNGMELLTEIKKVDHAAEIPVYMYSTTSEEEIVDRCRQLGAAGFIKKYANTDDVKTEFERVIHHLRSTPE
jgi:CheY-like chemotaxis protein